VRGKKVGFALVLCCLLVCVQGLAYAGTDSGLETFYEIVDEHQEHGMRSIGEEALAPGIAALEELAQSEGETALGGEANLHLGRLLASGGAAWETGVEKFVLAYDFGDVQSKAEALFELEWLYVLWRDEELSVSPERISAENAAAIFQEFLSALPRIPFENMTRKEHDAVRLYVNAACYAPWFLYENPLEMRAEFEGQEDMWANYAETGGEAYLDKLMACSQYLEKIQAPTMWKAQVYTMISEWYAFAGDDAQADIWLEKSLTDPDEFSMAEMDMTYFSDTIPFPFS